MTWVKLCGMRTRSDVEAAMTAGADAVGFVIAPRSLRFVEPALLPDLGRDCPLQRFLVSEDEDPDTLVAIALDAGMTGIQPHGQGATSAAASALAAGMRVLYPIDPRAYSAGRLPSGAMPIFDAATPGGGRSFDHAPLRDVAGPFVLAGGLRPETVAGVVSALSPFGVDVSSGIESEPGVKDPQLMRRFVEAVR
jgi:phosphoribosylanthranilate isomerase